MAKFVGFVEAVAQYAGVNASSTKDARGLLQAQEELKEQSLQVAAVACKEVTLAGDKTMTAVTIKPEAVDPDDVEMLRT